MRRRIAISLHASLFLVTGLALATTAVAATAASNGRSRGHDVKFTTEWKLEDCVFADAGQNRFLVLEPGHELRLAGDTKKGWKELTVTVLDETRVIDGVRTRVVEEVERLDGAIVSLSRNFLAICAATSDVVTFGAEVDISDDGAGGAIAEGSWAAGVNGAKPAILMPGTFMLGARHAVSLAPNVSEDRAENVAMNVSINTPAGSFEGAVEVLETTPLEPDAAIRPRNRSIRSYACPGRMRFGKSWNFSYWPRETTP